jgi:hypothetical protein
MFDGEAILLDIIGRKESSEKAMMGLCCMYSLELFNILSATGTVALSQVTKPCKTARLVGLSRGSAQ